MKYPKLFKFLNKFIFSFIFFFNYIYIYMEYSNKENIKGGSVSLFFTQPDYGDTKFESVHGIINDTDKYLDHWIMFSNHIKFTGKIYKYDNYKDFHFLKNLYKYKIEVNDNNITIDIQKKKD